MKLRRFVPLALVPLLAASIGVAAQQPAGAAAPPSATPAWTAATGDIHLSSPTIADVNGDGVKDVAIGTLDAKVHIFDGRGGGELPGWPQAVPAAVEASPTIADLDGSGTPTIIVGFGSLDVPNQQGGIIAFRADGTQRWSVNTLDVFHEWDGKSTPGPDGFREAVFGTPAVGDVNGDGSPDVVFTSFDHLLRAVDKNGAMLAGFPFDTADTIFTSPSLYDVDGDGRDEIFFGSDASGFKGCNLGILWSVDGSGAERWHRCGAGMQTIFQSSPAVGDIDGDGRLEMVIGAGTNGSVDNNKVNAVHLDDGSTVPGWPQTMNGNLLGSPAIGDVNGDGKPEVVIATCATPTGCNGKSSVVALRGDGSTLWSVVPQASITQNVATPIIGDLNGDGTNDVAVGCEGAFCLLNGANGSALEAPIDAPRTHQNAAAMADFGSGVGWRLVIASRANGAGQVAAYPMATPGSPPPWPQWKLNAAHVGAPAAPPPIPCTQGYWLGASDGGIFSFGATKFFGSAGNIHLNQPIVGMASTPTHNGYWLVARDGGIFAFGDAGFFGSTGNIRLNQPIVGMAPTPTGQGYWLVAADGGIFAFGDAAFAGSTGNIHLNQPIVGMAATPSGHGYWMAARDGGIFNFGDAPFLGSMGATKLNQPIVGIASTANGGGYWMVAADGGIFGFGDATFKGSTGAIKLNKPIVGMARTLGGNGYWLVATDGGIFAFGDAAFCGSTGNRRLNQPINAMAAAA